MTEMKNEENLRILKEMSTQVVVPGSIANSMYSDLRRRYPWHFLMYSFRKKSQKVIEIHKEFLLEQYKARVEVLIKSELTQQDVEELELINETLEKICKRKDPIEKYSSFLKHGFPENKPINQILKDYCGIDLKNHNLTSLFDEIEMCYQADRNNIQTTYGQYSSIKLLNKYDYIKNQILNLDSWSNDELLQNKDRQMFKSK
jgi:hypothetical protein